jgi:hypothetical protein
MHTRTRTSAHTRDLSKCSLIMLWLSSRVVETVCTCDRDFGMEPLCVFTSAFLCAIIRIWLSFTPNLCPNDRCLRVRGVCGEMGKGCEQALMLHPAACFFGRGHTNPGAYT